MPFTSKAQIRKFRQMVAEGKISQETFDEWMAATAHPEQLPERRVHVPRRKKRR